MNTSTECDLLSEHVGSYIDGALSNETAMTLRVHLQTCSHCRESVKNFRAVKGLLQYLHAQANEPSATQSPAAPAGVVASLPARLDNAPWWLVSFTMHFLVIVLASLVSMAVETPRNNDEVIMITELQQRPAQASQDVDPPKPDFRDVLQQHELQASDPKSNEHLNVAIPPDILARAELGDHFETIDPDRPDTHSACGNEDSRSFHFAEGSTDKTGGGGAGGPGVEDVIGIGGAGVRGTGGGFGGGDGAGIGVGSGAGKGCFGQRSGGGRKLLVKQHGGSRATESAVDMALQWLAYHQEPDGRWSSRNTESLGFKAGNFFRDFDPGVTGLCTLAFLGAGHSEKIGAYKENVQRAIKWMISQQRADGYIGTDLKWTGGSGSLSAYYHAICGLALAEAAGMSRIEETRQAAQKAVDYSCELHQMGAGSQKLGWRYDPKTTMGDVSCSGWFIMQLKSAKVAGLHVDPASLEGAMKFLNSCQLKPDNNAATADPYDNGQHRYTYCVATHAPMVNCTAIGSLCRMFLGTKSEEIRGAMRWLLKTWPADWSDKIGGGIGGAWPMYYTYYTTLAMFQVGGDEWNEWNEALKTMLVPHQRKDGDFRGSWDSLAENEKAIGRAYSTALGALSLEVYYRYQRLTPDK